MKLETILYLQSTYNNRPVVQVYSKINMWKIYPKNVIDLPQVTLKEMASFLREYFEEFITENSESTRLDNFEIATSSSKKAFQSTWDLKCKFYFINI
jgi:hypothetical protein